MNKRKKRHIKRQKSFDELFEEAKRDADKLPKWKQAFLEQVDRMMFPEHYTRRI